MLQRRTFALIAIGASAFLAFLDTTIVNTTFPSIAASFPGASLPQISWVLNAYFVVIAALLVPAGTLADRVGGGRLFMMATAGFAATSTACAAAPTWHLLVGARALQGVAAAVLIPVSLALLLEEYPVDRRATAASVWGAAAALASASGPTVGGTLAEYADWRCIFLVNVPLCVLVLAAGRRGLRDDRRPLDRGLPDVLGTVLIFASFGLIALALVQSNDWGWTSTYMIGSFASGGLFLGWVALRCATHPRPIIDPSLFRLRSFSVGNLSTLLFSIAFFSQILGNILFLTSIWHYSVLLAGLAVLPGPVMTTAVAVPAGRIADRVSYRSVIVPGVLAYAAGLLILRAADGTPDYLGTWLPGQALIGVGVGLAYPTLGAAALAEVTPTRYATASAIGSAARQLGAVLGTALLIAILGDPRSLPAALNAADRAYLLGIAMAVASGAVAWRLGPPQSQEVVAHDR